MPAHRRACYEDSPVSHTEQGPKRWREAEERFKSALVSANAVAGLRSKLRRRPPTLGGAPSSVAAEPPDVFSVFLGAGAGERLQNSERRDQALGSRSPKSGLGRLRPPWGRARTHTSTLRSMKTDRPGLRRSTSLLFFDSATRFPSRAAACRGVQLWPPESGRTQTKTISESVFRCPEHARPLSGNLSGDELC